MSIGNVPFCSAGHSGEHSSMASGSNMDLNLAPCPVSELTMTPWITFSFTGASAAFAIASVACWLVGDIRITLCLPFAFYAAVAWIYRSDRYAAFIPLLDMSLLKLLHDVPRLMR